MADYDFMMAKERLKAWLRKPSMDVRICDYAKDVLALINEVDRLRNRQSQLLELLTEDDERIEVTHTGSACREYLLVRRQS